MPFDFQQIIDRISTTNLCTGIFGRAIYALIVLIICVAVMAVSTGSILVCSGAILIVSTVFLVVFLGLLKFAEKKTVPEGLP